MDALRKRCAKRKTVEQRAEGHECEGERYGDSDCVDREHNAGHERRVTDVEIEEVPVDVSLSGFTQRASA